MHEGRERFIYVFTLIILIMVNMTFAIPEDIHAIMKKHTEIRWSEVARRAISSEAKKLALMDSLTTKSKLTLKDVEEINEKIKEGLFAKYR